MSDNQPPQSAQSPDGVPEWSIPEVGRPRTALGRWLRGGGSLDQPRDEGRSHPWYRVIWLTGVDYFSSLAYQPGIALIAAGALAPPATLILVAVTLGGALPVYTEVARRSYAGQGSIAMLEHLLSGWAAKIFVLVLLGFAATDFVITMTLSAADAARHAMENPYLGRYVAHSHMLFTIALLLLLALVFLIGLREAIEAATVIAIPYLLLNLIVLLAGAVHIARHPEVVTGWRLSLTGRGDWTALFIASALIFPKLALGLSGFETGVSVMPLISGGKRDPGQAVPLERIRATRTMLTMAALIMGAFLLLSSVVTTLLIPQDAYRAGGPASGRAIAYLAHRLLGDGFGSVYDLSTIAILWFAGASAMAGLINLVPRYLPRFGMAPEWVVYRRPLVLVLLVIDLVVTLAFHANVEAQGSAYATGVLALILSAALAVAIALSRESRASSSHGRTTAALSLCFWGITALFTYTLIANMIERPAGVVISAIFILVTLTVSAMSRVRRATELRVSGLTFADQSSAALWPSLLGEQVNLVPLHATTSAFRARKAAEIRAHYRVTEPLAFLHVKLLDNRSEFIAPLRVRVTREGENFVIDVAGAIAIANTIAYLSELIDPIGIFLGLTGRNLMHQSLRYLLLGEGEIGLVVYAILVRYWDWIDKGPRRPILYLTGA